MDTRTRWSLLRVLGVTLGLLIGIPASWLAFEGLVLCLDDPGDPLFGFAGLGGALLGIGLVVAVAAWLLVYVAGRQPREPS